MDRREYNETRKILTLLISKDKNTQAKIKGHAKSEILRVGGVVFGHVRQSRQETIFALLAEAELSPVNTD
jgi:hypothetical protein